MTAQLIDIQIFDNLRKKNWFIAPLTSSMIGSTVDTFLFFLISFYGTNIPWFTLALGDLGVKIFDYLRKKKWFIAPLTSSIIGSTVDTFLFFSISFY